jgi:hypothetical protein
VNPERQAFDITLQWTPQRQVWAGVVDLVGRRAWSLVIVVLTWKRRHVRGDRAGDTRWRGDGHRFHSTALARPGLGLLAAIAVSPVVGLVVALIAVVAWQPSLRAVMVLPAVLLFGCGLYTASSRRYRFPPVAEWLTARLGVYGGVDRVTPSPAT